MREIKNVQSTALEVKELEINVDTVYLRSNITKITIDNIEMWQYDEIQMTFREFEEYNANKIQMLENEKNQLRIDLASTQDAVNEIIMNTHLVRGNV